VDYRVIGLLAETPEPVRRRPVAEPSPVA